MISALPLLLRERFLSWLRLDSPHATKLTNLCAVALGSIYILWALLGLLQPSAAGFSPIVGGDYAVFLASAEIAHTHGFAAVYDLDTQLAVQVERKGEPPGSAWRVSPMFYIPVFVAPFELMLLVPPVVSFWIWDAASVLVTVLVLRSWEGLPTENARVNPLPVSLLPCLLFSFPFLGMLSQGQVDVFLLACLSEFLRAGMRGADLRSGAWLSVLLLKPQTLIVIVPGLVVARRWRCLAGLSAGAALLVAASVALGGVGALDAELGLFLRSTQGPDSARIITGPVLMTNWRALGIHLSSIASAPVLSILVVAGSAATFAAALVLWFPRVRQSGRGLAIATMGAYAAACSVSAHAHTSMSVPLIVPLLFLARERLLPVGVLAIWSLVPLVQLVQSIVIVFLDLPSNLPGINDLGVLLVNLIVLGWAVRLRMKRAEPEFAAAAA